MRQLSWQEKRTKIYQLMRAISDHYGGDVKSLLDEYFLNRIEHHKQGLDSLLKTLEDIVERDGIILKETRRPATNAVCSTCGYRPVFCRCHGL